MNLAAMQRVAEREARKLGISTTIRVQWKADCDGRRCGRYTIAHAHWGKDTFGTICVRRGQGTKKVIQHEVAHFASDKVTRHNTIRFLEARAKQGSQNAVAALIQRGKRRCPKHSWRVIGTLEQRVTVKGLLTLARARCAHCDKVIP